MRKDLRKALGVREHARLTAERMSLARDVLSRTSAERGVVLPQDGLEEFVLATDPHTGPMAARARDKGGSLRDDILGRIHASVARVMQADYEMVMAGAPEAAEAADPVVRAAMAKLDEAQEAVAHPTRDLVAEQEALELTRSARNLEAAQAAAERAAALARAGHHADAVAAAKEALLLRTGLGDRIEQHDRPRAVAEAQTVLHAQAAAEAEAHSMAEELGIPAGSDEHTGFVDRARAAIVKAALAQKRAHMAAARSEEAATAPDVVYGSILATEAAAAKPEALLPESFKQARDALVAAQEHAAKVGRQLRSRQRGQKRREQLAAAATAESGDGAPPAVAPVSRGAQETEALQASHNEAQAAVAEATKVAKQHEKTLAAMQKEARKLQADSAGVVQAATARFQQQYGVQPSAQLAVAARRAQAELEALRGVPLAQLDAEASAVRQATGSAEQALESAASVAPSSGQAADTAASGQDAAQAASGQAADTAASAQAADTAASAQAADTAASAQAADTAASAQAADTAASAQAADTAASAQAAPAPASASPATAPAPSGRRAVGSVLSRIRLAREVGESLAPLPRAAFGEVEDDGTGSGSVEAIVMAPQSLVDATVAMQKEQLASSGALQFDPFAAAAKELAEMVAGEVNATTLLADPELQRLREEARGELNRGEPWVEPREPYGSRQADGAEAKSDATAAAATAEAFVSGKDAAEAEADAEGAAPARFRVAPGMLPRVTPSDDELATAGVDGMIAAVEFEEDEQADADAAGAQEDDAVEEEQEEGESDEETRLLAAGRMSDLVAHPDELSGGEDEDSEANEPDLGEGEGELDPPGAPVATSLAGFLADDGVMDFVPRASEYEEVQDAALAAAEDEQLRRRASELELAASSLQGLTQEQRSRARREMADAKAVLAGSAPEVLSLFAGRAAPLGPTEAEAYLEGIEAQFGAAGRTPDSEQRLVHIAALHEEQQRLAEGRPYGQPSSMFREIFRGTALGSQVDAQLAAKGLSPSAPASAFVRGGELPVPSWRGAAAEAAAPFAEVAARPVPDAARTEAIMRLSGHAPAGAAELFALNAAQRFLDQSYANDLGSARASQSERTGLASEPEAHVNPGRGSSSRGSSRGSAVGGDSSAAFTASSGSSSSAGDVVELEAGAPLTAEAMRLATWSRWERSTEEMARQLHETARAEAAELEDSPGSGVSGDGMDASPGQYLADGRSQNPDDDFVDQVLPREGVHLYARASAHTATTDSAARATDLSTFLHRLNMGVSDTAMAAAQRQASEAVLALARTRAGRDMPAGTALLPRGGGAKASHGTRDASGLLRPGARAVGPQAADEIAQELLEGVPLAASSDVHRAVSTEAIGRALEAAAAADSAMQRLVSAPAHRVVLRARAASRALDLSARAQTDSPGEASSDQDGMPHEAVLDGGMVGEEEQDIASLVRAVRRALDRGQAPGTAEPSQQDEGGADGGATARASGAAAEGAFSGFSATGLGRDDGLPDKLFGDSVTALELAAAEAQGLSGSGAGDDGAASQRGGGTSELPEGWRGMPALSKTTSMSARLRRAQLLSTSGRRVDLEHVMTATFRHTQEQQPWDLHHSVNYEAHHFRMLEAVQHRDLDSALHLFRAATMRRGARMLLSGKDSDDRAEADVRGSGEYAGQPDWLAANILLDAAARARCPSVAHEAVTHIVGRGGAIGPDQLTLLLKGASLRGDLVEARQLYARIGADGKRPRLADHAAMMSVQFHNGQHRRALATLNHVIRSGEAPTAHMFATALRYLSRDDRYEEMHHVWKALQLSPALKPSARTLSRLVRSFARGGRLDDAWEVFLAMRSAAHGRVIPDKDTLVILYSLLLDNGRTQHARRMLALLDSLGHLGPKPGSRSYRARRRSGDIDAAMSLRADLEAALHAAEDGPAESGQRMRIRGIVDSAPRYGVPYLPEDAEAEKRRWASVWQRSTVDVGAADAFFGDDQGRRGADGHAFVPPGRQSIDEEMEDTLEQAVADTAFRR
jgi:pentatricopeptide repeat protein